MLLAAGLVFVQLGTKKPAALAGEPRAAVGGD